MRQDLATIAPGVVVSTPGLAGYRQIVDNGTRGRFRARKRSWRKTHRGRPYFGGARYATASPTSDAARFKLVVPTTGDYTVYARWTASRANSSRVPIGVRTTAGISWRHVNQRRHGHGWRRIGTFQLPAGDAWSVLISRWTRAGGYVVADGVKIVAAP